MDHSRLHRRGGAAFQLVGGAVAVVAVAAIGVLLYWRLGYAASFTSPAALLTSVSSDSPAAQNPSDSSGAQDPPGERNGKHSRAPELDGGVAWLNTSHPIHLRDLRGKIVLLDFWTFCCINCIHTLPDLARLEKKYANQLVVIGVHSAKFDNERNSDHIRKAILRYEITHPVVNDADMKIWNAYDVRSWPTLCLIDPEGNLVAHGSGEGLGEAVDKAIAQLVKEYRAKKLLNERPLRFDLDRAHEPGDTPLYFPGKILADGRGKRLFIADSTHHRIVITDLGGKKIAIAGTGMPGKADGRFEEAQFNDPQGMALRGNALLVADRKNDLIRSLDLERLTVTTIAGNGTHGYDRQTGGPALKIGLTSPWDLCLIGDKLYIAQAGLHQIWLLDLAKGEVQPFAGCGREDILDGPLEQAAFAQPSGLTTDGKSLYVADSEVSAIRRISLSDDAGVTTLVGEGLFEFGDKDGTGRQVRLQHALGVAYHDGKLYVADTYNSKIKVLDPGSRACTSLHVVAPNQQTGPLFHEPGGLSFAGDQLFVADTNAHRIQVVDLKSGSVSTLKLQGVAPPRTTAVAVPKGS